MSKDRCKFNAFSELIGKFILTSWESNRFAHHFSNRQERSFHVLAISVRTIGSLICLICASMLKMTSSHLVYSNQFDGTIFHSWSTSRDRATWISSMGLGLGLGLTAGSGLNVYHPCGHRLYLALLLGQLIVPASSGYLTERVLHKNASQTLGRTAVVLSILMFISLSIDLILQVVRRFSWWNIVTKWFSCLPEQSEMTVKCVSVEESAKPKNNLTDHVWNQSVSSPAMQLQPIRISIPEP